MATTEVLQILLKILTFLCMVVACAFFYKLLHVIASKTGNVEEKIKNNIDTSLKTNGTMSKHKLKLSKYGIMYRAKDYNLNPSWYMLARIAIGVLAGLVLCLLTEEPVCIIVGIPAGYILTDVLFKKMNESDNKEMMMDLYSTYASLKIQMEAGIYIVDSIEYVHNLAQNRRYKEALGELVINFSNKTVPLLESVEIFKNRFASKDIDKLCALLQSCVTYGAQKAYAKDIMGEIQGILSAEAIESENKIETKTSMINFAFFAILIVLVGFSIFSSFGDMELFW